LLRQYEQRWVARSTGEVCAARVAKANVSRHVLVIKGQKPKKAKRVAMPKGQPNNLLALKALLGLSHVAWQSCEQI
jgi:hypothetical protein